MIIEEYDESLFIQRFENMHRVTTSENIGNFSYKGLRFLFNYLDETHDEENPYKLDVIGLCCEFSEYKDLNEYLRDYSNEEEIKEVLKELKEEDDERDLKEIRNSEEFKRRFEEEISEKTTLIKFEDDLNEGFIISQY